MAGGGITKGIMRLLEVKGMFIIVSVMFSQMYSSVRTYQIVCLSKCSLLHVSFT